MKRAISFATLVCLAAIAGSKQSPGGWTPPADTRVDTMYFETKLGSFKSIDGIGVLEFSFTGTAMLSNVKGQIIPSGNLRKEYSKDGRTTFFGTGTLKIVGSWRGIQWFGRNMKASWYGAGFARLYGEFDQKLETGFYWFKSNPKRNAWSPYGTSLVNPPMQLGATGVPVPRPKKNP